MWRDVINSAQFAHYPGANLACVRNNGASLSLFSERGIIRPAGAEVSHEPPHLAKQMMVIMSPYFNKVPSSSLASRRRQRRRRLARDTMKRRERKKIISFAHLWMKSALAIRAAADAASGCATDNVRRMKICTRHENTPPHADAIRWTFYLSVLGFYCVSRFHKLPT